MFQKNDMMMLNDIIYKIYTIGDFDVMRASVLESIQFLIPYDIATFSLSSPEKPYELISPVCIGLPNGRWNMYETEFHHMDYTRWTFSSPIAKAYRETDLIDDEERINTPYYKKMFAPSNIHYSAILTLIKDEEFLGCINLFRRIDNTDFSDEEMLMLDLLKDHLSYRLSKRKESIQHSKEYQLNKDYLTQTYDLTRREIEILLLLLDGVDKNEIADKLCISPNTLKKHTSNIYSKTSVSSYRELVKLMEQL